MGFGMGCCYPQVTSQASNVVQSRQLYERLADGTLLRADEGFMVDELFAVVLVVPVACRFALIIGSYNLRMIV